MTEIKKLEITSFGKFHDHVMEFGSGYNEFVLENEYGKSTVTDFILFMLYGFVKTTSKKLELQDNLVKKYLPWEGEAVLSGAMELECDGRLLRLERLQNDGRKKSVVLRDVTGGELEIYDSPGQMLYGVDMETFLRTFLIRQTDMKFYGTGGIDAALKNLVTTGDEEVSFESANELLTKKNNKFRHGDRMSGRIFDIKKELANIELERARFLSEKENLADSVKNHDEIDSLISKCDSDESELKSMLPLAQSEDYRRLLSEISQIDLTLSELKLKAQELQDSADIENIPEISEKLMERDMLIKSVEEAKTAVESAKAQLTQKLSFCPQYEQFHSNEEQIRRVLAQKPRFNLPIMIVGALLAMLGGVLIIMQLPMPGLCAAVLGVGAIVLSFVLKRKDASSFGMSYSELCLAFGVYLDHREDIEMTGALLDKALVEYEKLTGQLENAKFCCDEIYKKYGVIDRQGIIQLTDAKLKYGQLTERIRFLQESREKLLYGRDITELEAAAKLGDCKYTKSEIQEQITDVVSRKNSLILQKQALSDELLREREAAKRVWELEEKTAELQEELDNAVYQNSVLSLAQSALQEAYDNINRVYSPMLTEYARDIISFITDGKYDSIYLDRDFNIRVKSGSQLFELGYFSRGTADAVYFALRLAVADLISKKSAMPVIMDDPFWTLDDKRLKNARRFAQKMAQNRQVIIFSARN